MSFFVAGPSRSAVTAPQRPLALVATLGGAVAALMSLGVCMVVGVIGWYLTDAGSHGSATSGLRVGAVGWLVGQGTGLTLPGYDLQPMPLAITALILWVTWQVGLRVGGMVADHGPDADGIADGSRDLVVPTAGLLFVLGYVVVALVVDALASRNGSVTASATLSATFPLALLVGLPAIAVDSGRLQVWVADVPEDLRGLLAGVRGLLIGWFIVSAAAFLVALLVHGTKAVNMVSETHLHGGSAVSYIGSMLLVLPNAVVFAGSYLLGAPFSLGAGSTVAPHALHGGPGAWPWIPWLAATPTTNSSWMYAVLALPVAVAVVVAVRLERRTPAPSVVAAAIRASAYSLLAAIAVGVLGWWAGGAVGSGLMVRFGTSVGAMFVHALYWIVLPSIVAAAAASWWEGRRSS
ncbi:hypothetical protein Back2_09230 [Nocardioides baekrokdamisoli]|uniref:Uncharacterized protein n=1 Tax=Nocardioides baekrokdamisoli TaxID=1804624 RepID=A0A3G9IE62_9ACTN|nr:DUF6350 family protein [Nocardioides baekrokdamisoli]BBH16636.1 hypothetical protein Back2_09230 [Nocardioides baekrokdamisoli]